MRIAAIIQARMGSTRLPDKVLLDISGKPMLWHVITRLKYSALINKIIIATSHNKKDDAIEDFCKEYNIDFYRGSEDDVLDRYYQAAREYAVNVMARITADCPLIDPTVADKVISLYLKNAGNFDGASNTITRSYPRGLDTEVFSFRAIEKAWERAKDACHREHVTPYIYENMGSLFRVLSVENKENLSGLRWTVDEEADLKFMREIFKRLYSENKIFVMDDVLEALKKESRLIDINRNVKQKTIIK